MVTDLIEGIADALFEERHQTNGGYITELGGLARPTDVEYTDETGKPGKRRVPLLIRPVSDQPDERALVPDQEKRCIVFFDATAFEPRQSERWAIKGPAGFSLLCWYNEQGFADKELLLTRLIADLDTFIKRVVVAGVGELYGPIQTTRIVENDAAIFAKYTFSDGTSKYFTQPFGCFRIDYKTDLLLNENCLTPLIPFILGDCGWIPRPVQSAD